MSRRSFFILCAVSIVALVLGVNTLAAYALKGWRLDFSADKLYTLSRGAVDAVRDVDEPIDLTFVYSRGLAQDYPQIRAYGARVRETLKSVAARSGGAVRLTVVDPEPFSEEEDEAIAAGLDGAATDAGERLYFGLVARNALDETVVVPFFNPEREPYLEYELARAVTELTRPSARRVTVITSLPREPGDTQGYALDQLSRAFDLTYLERDFTAIPADTEMLTIIHPWDLSEAQLYAVDQFVLATGRALVFVDPLSQLAIKPGPTGLPRFDAEAASQLGPLLGAWGVNFDPSRVVLDRANAVTATVEEEGRLIDRLYPLWQLQPPERMSDEDLITAPLQTGVVFAAPGLLTAREGATAQITPLVQSSADSVAVDVDAASEAQTPQEIMSAYDAAVAAGDAPVGPLMLAVRASGLVGSAYPDGAPEPPEADFGADTEADFGADLEDAPAAHRADGRIEVIVVADTDIFDDAFYVRTGMMGEPTAVGDNANLVLNALDVLSGSDALVRLRSRARAGRPMDRVDRLRAEAETRFLEQQSTLEAELALAEERLAAISSDGRGTALFAGDGDISPDERAELERIRDVITSTRAQLRDVQGSFRRDIDGLAAWLTFFNVWFGPILVILAGFFIIRRRRGPGGAA